MLNADRNDAAQIRFGIAGVGRHGSRYARHFARRDVPGATVRRVWRRDEALGQALAEELGVAYERRVEALFEADDVDAVILAVPSGLHHRLALKVASAGKPLLLEKPLARTTQEATEIIEAFETRKLPLTIGQTLRFDPLVTAGQRALADFGPLVGFGFEQRLEPRGLAWEEDPALAGGGVLAQTAIHTADALRFITRPESVEVIHTLTARLNYPAHEDLGLAQLALYGCPQADGRTVFGDLRVSKIGASRHHRYALFAQSGGVELDFIDRKVIMTEGRQRREELVPARPTVPALAAAFVDFLKGEGPNPVPPRDAFESLAVIERAYRASRGLRSFAP